MRVPGAGAAVRGGDVSVFVTDTVRWEKEIMLMRGSGL